MKLFVKGFIDGWKLTFKIADEIYDTGLVLFYTTAFLWAGIIVIKYL